MRVEVATSPSGNVAVVVVLLSVVVCHLVWLSCCLVWLSCRLVVVVWSSSGMGGHCHVDWWWCGLCVVGVWLLGVVGVIEWAL